MQQTPIFDNIAQQRHFDKFLERHIVMCCDVSEKIGALYLLIRRSSVRVGQGVLENQGLTEM